MNSRWGLKSLNKTEYTGSATEESTGGIKSKEEKTNLKKLLSRLTKIIIHGLKTALTLNNS